MDLSWTVGRGTVRIEPYDDNFQLREGVLASKNYEEDCSSIVQNCYALIFLPNVDTATAKVEDKRLRKQGYGKAMWNLSRCEIE